MQWTTEFSVVARHHRNDSAPVLRNGYCVLAVDGDAMMLVCESPDGTVESRMCTAEDEVGLLLFHDMLVPRLHLVPTPPRPSTEPNTPQRMTMFNAPRLRAIK